MLRGPGAGTISGLGGSGVVTGAVSGAFAGFGAYVIGTIGTWGMVGANALGAGQTLTDNGSLIVDGSLAEAAGATISVAANATTTFTGGSSVSVLAGTITGLGTVAFTGGLDAFYGSTLSAAHMTITGASMTLASTITNTGTVSVVSSALGIGPGVATLAGGTWVLTQTNFIGDTGTLNNASATIFGDGLLGASQMVLINRSDGVIDGGGSKALIIDTGLNQIATSGLIEATAVGGVVIQSAVLNGGRLEANGGTLTVNGGVTGSHGTGVIASGALVFNSTFAENVTFSGARGVLRLAKSQGYTGAVTGFSKTGGTSLDLGDIAFVSASEATYSGTATSGVLTVTDGVHAARVNFTGDYLAATFTASNDGHGGTIVTDRPTAPSAIAPAHRFVAAMAGLGVEAAAAMSAGRDTWRPPPAALARPGVVIA